MSSPRQNFLPGHPQPTPEAIARDDKIREAFLELGRALTPTLEFLPSGSKALTIQKKIAGYRYRLTITPAEEK